MLKLPKGLKKKKKGKKSKHKDDELFKPEELEAYRREHQQQHAEVEEPTGDNQPASSGGNEEWKKFIALTSGVDDILKKTQGDLDRIKSTSFFQRVPTSSEVRKHEEEKEAEVRAEEEAKAEEKRFVAAVEAAIVEVSESESEDEDEDDIFDTAYIDAVASGEVKLAYIPESPTEEPDDDPFDTTYAEKAILGPTTERRGHKLVPLGSAVEILTGRVQAPSCVSVKRPTSRRQVFKERDLLLGSFDASNQETDQLEDQSQSAPVQASLLDDDAPAELANEPIDLAKVIVAPISAPLPTPKPEDNKEDSSKEKDILEEFDVLQKVATPEDEDDIEFALLAAESLSKPKQVAVLEVQPAQVVKSSDWNAFGEQGQQQVDEGEEQEVDPFDTTFAENILPGQAELKQIEKEILDSDNDLDFNPRAEETYSELIRNSVSIQLTNPSGQRESVSSLDRVHENELSSITTIHRDLLGGSNTDLSQLGEAIQPKDIVEEEEDNFDYSDPFDTSAVDTVTLPGTTELKFLERELLGDINEKVKAPVQIVEQTQRERSFSDEDFDPRAFDSPVQPPINRKVSFDLQLKPDFLGAKEEDSKKPLTPYYIREDSISEQDIDPFDTSFVVSGPGRAELKLIEKELFHSEFNSCDFNPRDEKQIAVAKVVQEIEDIVRRPSKPVILPIQVVLPPEPIDLLAADNDSGAKVLTPAAESKSFEDAYIDPFDTSIASNILPGKTELKLLESELITNAVPDITTAIKRNLTDPDFDPRIGFEQPPPQTSTISANINILEADTGLFSVKPLTPISFEIGFDEDEDIDPFDTSIANNIAPGPSELKLLESELI